MKLAKDSLEESKESRGSGKSVTEYVDKKAERETQWKKNGNCLEGKGHREGTVEEGEGDN